MGLAEIDDVEQALDVLVKVPFVDQPGVALHDAVVALERIQAKVDAAKLSASAAFEASGEWRFGGNRSPAVFLRRQCRMPHGRAKRQVHAGRELRQLADTAAALADGEISLDHVSELVGHKAGGHEPQPLVQPQGHEHRGGGALHQPRRVQHQAAVLEDVAATVEDQAVLAADRETNDGRQAIVVSAMAGVTDALLEWIDLAGRKDPEQENAQLVH